MHNEQHFSALKFITCGSVDDGKSTLIGRLLVDTRPCCKTTWQACSARVKPIWLC
jgi:sulfate adenylyltransferase subunit 1 (EFTu-like GTPase family)